MNRRMVVLNVALLALIGSLAWLLRAKWLGAQAVEKTTLAQTPRPAAVVAPPPAPAPPPVAPGDYIEVAQKTLFSKDRNPIPVVDPPKLPPPPPPPPMPALPSYFGQMTLGNPVVLLGTGGGGDQKSYAVGDKIGEFKVLAFSQESVTFEWNGQEVERKIGDLAPKPNAQQAAAAAPAAAPAAPAVTSLSSPSGAAQDASSNKSPALGTDMGGGFRACAAGDPSPAGTVLSGYKKVISQSLMGQSCYWEKVK